MSTVNDWLASREPVPPPALMERLRATLGGELGRDAATAADVCLEAGERLLARVLEAEQANRDCAFDLLTADALVTYAFEAASAEPDRLGDLARDAMARLSRAGLP